MVTIAFPCFDELQFGVELAIPIEHASQLLVACKAHFLPVCIRVVKSYPTSGVAHMRICGLSNRVNVDVT